MKGVRDVLGPRFKGTLIEDPVLEPFFITQDAGGGFTVHRKRFNARGELKYSDVCYPVSFSACLSRIAKEKLGEPGKSFATIQEYLDRWKEICNEIENVYKNWGINQL